MKGVYPPRQKNVLSCITCTAMRHAGGKRQCAMAMVLVIRIALYNNDTLSHAKVLCGCAAIAMQLRCVMGCLRVNFGGSNGV